MKLLLTTLLCICLLPQAWADESWPRFRGPLGNGVVDGTVPLKWSETEHVAWKSEVSGKGHSSPVVGDGKIWLTTAVTRPLTDAEKAERLSKVKDPRGLELVGNLSLRAQAFDLVSGQLVNDIELFQPQSPEPIHVTNTYASPTPVWDRGRVYFHFGTYGAACVDAKTGDVVWRFNDINVDHQNGPGSSPIIWDDLLIAHYDGTDKQLIAALRLSDGSLVWKTERSGAMNPTPEMQKAYCTPTVVQGATGPELISPAADWVYAYNPKDGSELWKANYGKLGFSTVPCPVVGHGMVYVCTSFMQSRLLAVKYSGQGDVTDSNIVWTADSNISQKPSLALVGQQLFVISDAGILTCLDAITGKELWRHRVGGKFAASPLIVGNRIYLFSQEGKTTVFEAGPEYRELVVNELDSGCNASPAAVDGALIIRTDSHLYRIQ